MQTKPNQVDWYCFFPELLPKMLLYAHLHFMWGI